MAAMQNEKVAHENTHKTQSVIKHHNKMHEQLRTTGRIQTGGKKYTVVMHRQAALTKNICSLKEISEKQVHDYQPCGDNSAQHFQTVTKHFKFLRVLHAISLLR